MTGLIAAAGTGLVVWLMVAGAVGAVLRLLCDHHLSPRGILVVNVAGSFVAGLATGLAAGGSPLAVQVWVSGFAGALTTFSTVSVSTALELVSGRWGAAVSSWAAHLGFGLLAVVLGLVSGTVLGLV